MACGSLAGCPFFNDKMPMDQGLGAMYKNKFCMGAFQECARFKVSRALGQDNVPSNLYPNMLPVAEKLIAQKK